MSMKKFKFRNGDKIRNILTGEIRCIAGLILHKSGCSTYQTFDFNEPDDQNYGVFGSDFEKIGTWRDVPKQKFNPRYALGQKVILANKPGVYIICSIQLDCRGVFYYTVERMGIKGPDRVGIFTEEILSEYDPKVSDQMSSLLYKCLQMTNGKIVIIICTSKIPGNSEQGSMFVLTKGKFHPVKDSLYLSTAKYQQLTEPTDETRLIDATLAKLPNHSNSPYDFVTGEYVQISPKHELNSIIEIYCSYIPFREISYRIQPLGATDSYTVTDEVFEWLFNEKPITTKRLQLPANFGDIFCKSVSSCYGIIRDIIPTSAAYRLLGVGKEQKVSLSLSTKEMWYSIQLVEVDGVQHIDVADGKTVLTDILPNNTLGEYTQPVYSLGTLLYNRESKTYGILCEITYYPSYRDPRYTCIAVTESLQLTTPLYPEFPTAYIEEVATDILTILDVPELIRTHKRKIVKENENGL